MCLRTPRDIIKKNFGVEGVVVNNIVEIDYDKVSFMKGKSNKKNDQINIVSVGRLAPPKRWMTSCEVFRNVPCLKKSGN